MDNLTFKRLILGSKTEEFTYLAYNENDKKIFKDKPYFNKSTEEIRVYKCKLANEFSKIIDEKKDVLLISVLYTINNFGKGIISKIKDYIYIDNTLYLDEKDLRTFPKEIKLLLEDYFNN